MARLILGHTTDTSIKIWVRASSRWPVAFVDVLDSAGRRTAPTQALPCPADDFYTEVLNWGNLSPQRPYTVKVAFGKTSQARAQDRIREAYTTGTFQTFPAPGDGSKFSFLLGSCNLHSLGIVKNPDEIWLRIAQIAQLDHNNARFMIHCGDQIYADIPWPSRPDPEHYRAKYLDAWEDCRPMQKFLTELPHYMILDDHEVTNNFDRDMGGNSDYESLLRTALKVYYEFQHKHNPDTPPSPRQYHYTFSYGDCQFFVLDTRTWRRSNSGQMIDDNQMNALKQWLSAHKDQLKFIVSSVPFVGEVNAPKQDKWCDPVYQGQRLELIQHLWGNNIAKTVFLSGDMHTSYHAQMTIAKNNRQILIHELMSSPVNQFTPDINLDDVYHPTKTIPFGNGFTVTSAITANTFYGNHSNVMAIEVDGSQINYRIYRTTRDERAAKRGSFTP